MIPERTEAEELSALRAMRDRIAERMERDVRGMFWGLDRARDIDRPRFAVTDDDGWRSERVRLFAMSGERWDILIFAPQCEAACARRGPLSRKPTAEEMRAALKRCRSELAAWC